VQALENTSSYGKRAIIGLAGPESFSNSEGEKERPIEVSILRPEIGDLVPHAVSLEGTVLNLPYGVELWVVKEPSPGNFHPDRGPALIEDNCWRATAFIGNAAIGADQGEEFIIHLVAVTHETSWRFHSYLDKAHITNSWIGISTLFGGQVVGTVRVIRDDTRKRQG
jgi:hypothetical protein